MTTETVNQMEAVVESEDRVVRETLVIDGMTCDHCVRAVRQVLAETPGVEVASVSIGSAEIAYDPAALDRRALAAAIEEEGYRLVGNG